MRRRIASMAVALMVAFGCTFVAAAPAQAHNQWQCPHGQSCLFSNIDGGGWIFNIVWSGNPRNTCVNLPWQYRNQASSVVADFGSGWDLMLYQDYGCTDNPDRFGSPSHKNFVWCNTCNGYWWLNDDVEAFKIVQ